MNKHSVYFAAPLFSLAEREFNNRIVTGLRKLMPELNFIVPQEYADESREKKGFIKIAFDYCISSIEKADVMLCMLDGSDADSGTCIEMGCAYALGKPIIGVRTDFRGSEDRGLNLMVSGVCKELITLPGNLTGEEEVIEKIISALSAVLPENN